MLVAFGSSIAQPADLPGYRVAAAVASELQPPCTTKRKHKKKGIFIEPELNIEFDILPVKTIEQIVDQVGWDTGHHDQGALTS